MAIPMTPRELTDAIKAGKVKAQAPKATRFGTSLAAFKLDGKTPTFQACGTKGPYVHTSKGILDGIKDGDEAAEDVSDGSKEDVARRSISFKAPSEGDLRELLDAFQKLAEDSIREGYPVWKKPDVARLPNVVKLMRNAGQDPDQISDEEIESTNQYFPNASRFAMPVVLQGMPIKDKPNETYPPVWKCKIQVRAANQMPPATFAHIFEIVKDGIKQRVIKDPIDYHVLCQCAFECIPIVQLVGIMFKADQWRVLLTVTKLFKVGEGHVGAEPALRMDDGEEAPIPVDQVAGDVNPKNQETAPKPLAPVAATTATSSLGKRPATESQASEPKVQKIQDYEDPEDANRFF